jgi:small ligand-binding sensory domain FIST
MYSFKFGHANARRWQEAAQTCLTQLGEMTPPPNLGFLYTSDSLADRLHDILYYFKEHTGVLHWVGSVGVGVCSLATEYFDAPAITVMVGHFPEHSFRVFSTIGKELKQFARAHQEWCNHYQPMFGIVHGDPRNGRIPELIFQLSEHLGGSFLVGGLTSSRHQFLQIADDITEGGISGVLFANDIQVATRLTQGCSVIGPRHQVTECDNHVVIRLDNRAALDVFKEDIGKELASNLKKVSGLIFVGLPVVGSDTGDYMVRNLMGIDVDNKMLAIGDIPKPGMSIFFTRRDAKAAQEDLLKMLNHLKNRIKTVPKGGLYYSCVGRGEFLFGKDSQELKTIQNVLGDFPIVGFFANGEISYQRLYGYSGVLTLFL